MLKDVENLPMLEVMELAKKAELNRQLACIMSSKSYIKKKARERGLTVEEYVKERAEKRGRKRIYFPDGLPPEKN
jgi:hypothetical protein